MKKPFKYKTSMKKIFTLILVLLSRISFAQNLVPNPSFEDTLQCPDDISQIHKVAEWNAARPTPDYFNSCSTDTLFNGQIIVGVPSNGFGFRTAASGAAYSGIISKGGNSEDREIISAQLITPLQFGIKYYVSFQVSLAGHANPSQYCGINKLGALFSTVHYDSLSLAPICNCSQIYSDSIITDTLNWIRIADSFIADSNYTFINIGRFFVNSQTDSVQIAGSLGFAYYFIDDVCVSTDSIFTYTYSYTGINNTIDNKVIIKSYPNPIIDFITIDDYERTAKQMKIYNSLGQEIKSFYLSNLQRYVFDLSFLSKGVYQIKIIQKNLNSKYTSIIKL